MKTSRLAQQLNAKKIEVENYIRLNHFNFRNGMGGMELFDSEVDDFIRKFNADKAEREATEQAEREAREKNEAEKQAAIASIMITSGFNFEGYTITKYSGYISGDDVVEIPRGREGILASATNVGDALSNALVKIRIQALAELKEAALALGCNAVIGVDFDYITLEPETVTTAGGKIYLPYVICVTANGNAVVIEKNE